jgi:mannose-6-phosphate isomerase-like protein (cupin superfamily)
MVSQASAAHARRVIAGVDASGRSTVLKDEVTTARTVRPNGAVVQEVWRQERLPAKADDDGAHEGEMETIPPLHGAAIRVYTLPPDNAADIKASAAALASVFGEGNVGDASSVPGMHRTNSLYVVTVVSGDAYAVLETGEVLLRPGDTLVLPGSMHTWRNPTDEPTTMVYTVFHIAE